MTMAMKEEPHTNIGWSANERYLQDFANFFEMAQLAFQSSRDNIKLLPSLFDHVHEVYRMEQPYFEKRYNKEKELDADCELATMIKKHDDLQRRMDKYRTADPIFRKTNFRRLFNDVDLFFSILTTAAVEHNFFPRATRERTYDDKLDSMRQK